jgi:hypothetical protein
VNLTKTATSLFRTSICMAAFCALRLSADVVVTSNGARIVGKIKLIHAGVITMSTDYAGDIAIKQSLVTSITTDMPVAVRTTDGTRLIGVVSQTPGGGVAVTSPNGTVATPVGRIAATWAAGLEDPDIVALRRKWTYEAGVDINGQTGTNHELNTDYSFKATLTGPKDLLKLYTDYNRQEADGVVSTDQFKAGVDYSDNFATLESWYVRDEAGFDRVNDILFYDIAAGGLGYDFIKRDNETLTGRAGLSYRYDEYSGPGASTLSEPGADFGFEYTRKFKTSLLADTISFDPTFHDPSEFVINHEVRYDIPLVSPYWKLSLGMTNSYNSRPVNGIDKLDTLYFARLVLTWGVLPTPP